MHTPQFLMLTLIVVMTAFAAEDNVTAGTKETISSKTSYSGIPWETTDCNITQVCKHCANVSSLQETNSISKHHRHCVWSCSGIPHTKPRVRTHQTANLCQIRHSYVPVTYRSCDCKFFAAKNWNICGPITAKNAKFAAAIIAVQKEPYLFFRCKTKIPLTQLNWFFRPQLNCILRYDDGSLDGVTGAFVISSSITCFLWHWPLISVRVFFSYTARIIYDSLLTLSKHLFLIGCRVLLLDKIPVVHGTYPVHSPTNHSDLNAFRRVNST